MATHPHATNVALGRARDLLRLDSAMWRRALAAGVEHGPDAWVRYSPTLFGVAFGAALPDARRRVLSNLRLVLGPRPAHVEARDVMRVFSTYAHALTESLLLASGRGYALSRRASGVDHYLDCVRGGAGVIVATAHTAGWELAGHVLASVHGREVVLAMRAERDPAARAIQDAARRRMGVEVVHVGDEPTDALPLLGRLRRGAAVALQIDRVPEGMRSRAVRLFGRPWTVPEGPLVLAALSGAPILPVFTRRLGFLDYEAIVGAPVRLPRRPSPAQLDEAAQALAGALERFLCAHPTQWFHFV